MLFELIITKIVIIFVGAVIYNSHIIWIAVSKLIERKEKQIAFLTISFKIIGVIVMILASLGLFFDFFRIFQNGNGSIENIRNFLNNSNL